MSVPPPGRPHEASRTMLKSIWKLLLMFNGVSSEDDEREARRRRQAERRRVEDSHSQREAQAADHQRAAADMSSQSRTERP